MAVFLNISPFSLVDADRRFRSSFRLHHHSDGETGTHEMSDNFYETKRRSIPQNCRRHTTRTLTGHALLYMSAVVYTQRLNSI
jgi:hypothetical protein